MGLERQPTQTSSSIMFRLSSITPRSEGSSRDGSNRICARKISVGRMPVSGDKTSVASLFSGISRDEGTFRVAAIWAATSESSPKIPLSLSNFTPTSIAKAYT